MTSLNMVGGLISWNLIFFIAFPLSAFEQNCTEILPTPSLPEGTVVWKSKKLNGPIFSTPSIMDGDVFLGSSGTPSGRGTFYRLSLDSPDPIWEIPMQNDVIFSSGSPNKNNESMVSSSLGGEPTFVGSGNAVCCYEQFTRELCGIYNTSGPVCTTPLPVGNLLIVGSGPVQPRPAVGQLPLMSFLYAFNILDESMIWREPGNNTKHKSHLNGCAKLSSPTLYEPTDNIIFGCDGYMYSVDRNDGTENWSFSTGASEVTAPTVDHDTGTVYFGDNEGRLWAVQPEQNGLRTSVVVKKWSSPWSSQITGAAIRAQPRVVTSHSLGTLILVGSDDSYVYVIRDDGTTGTCLYKVKTGDAVRNTPATGNNGFFYFGSLDGYLYAVDIATGSIQWRYHTDSIEYSSPVVHPNFIDDVVVVGSTNNHVYAIKRPMTSMPLFKKDLDSTSVLMPSQTSTTTTLFSNPIVQAVAFVGGAAALVVGGVLAVKTLWNRFHDMSLRSEVRELQPLIR